MSEVTSGAAGDDFRRTLRLAFASIGVVFGDIGTSPLYAMRESLAHVAGAGGNVREDVLAVASLLIWALILIVTIKYVLILMRADNKTLLLTGPQMQALPNVTATVTAVTTYIGVIAALSKDDVTLNLAIGHEEVPDLPTPPAIVPQSGTRTFAVLNRIGNGAPDFVFPLGNPFQLGA